MYYSRSKSKHTKWEKANCKPTALYDHFFCLEKKYAYVHPYIYKGKTEVILNHSDRGEEGEKELKTRALSRRRKRVKGKFAFKKKNYRGFGPHAYYHKRKRFKYLPSASKIHVIK